MSPKGVYHRLQNDAIMLNMQGNIGIVAQPPQWLWEGMAAFAPEAAELACEGVDVASAAAYFKVHWVIELKLGTLLFRRASLCVSKTPWNTCSTCLNSWVLACCT